MVKFVDFKFRNFDYLYSDDKYLLVATKDEIPDDTKYLNMIYENLCPLCEDEDKEDFPVGMCKIDHKNVIKFGNSELSDIVKKDLKEKYDNIDPDENITVLLIKNNLV